jgi:hypothetical protein
MFEVAERFYIHLVPQTRELIEHARTTGSGVAAGRVERVLDDILARPEHAWYQEGATDQMEAIRRQREERYGEQSGQSGQSGL